MGKDFHYFVFISRINGPGQLSRYSDSLRARRSGDRIPVPAKFSAPVQTGHGAHLSTYTMAKGKVHSTADHEAPQGEYSIALLSFTLGARWGWVVNDTPRPLYLRERPGTHCIGGWVGPGAGLDRYGKFRPPTGVRSPDRPVSSESLYRCAIPASKQHA